jgi:hypothetical protein
MPLPTIPAGIFFTVSGYTSEGPGGVSASEVAGGLPRVAMEWDRGVQAFRGTAICKPIEFEMWTLFYLHTIKKGAISFQMYLDSGLGVSLHNVTMIPGSYATARSSNGVDTAVTFGVWAESQGYGMTADEAADVLALYEATRETLSPLLARVATFVADDMDSVSAP